MQDVLVVKLGGSSASSPDFKRWIEAIEKATRRVILVPGGGPFANAVRRYQTRMGYDDAAAHRMSVLAMEQFGLALTSLGTRMATAGTRDEIAAVLGSGRIAVWMPPLDIVSRSKFCADPNVTSDTIAAWASAELGAGSLLLVKQLDLPLEARIDTLVHAGLVDPMFVECLSPATRLYYAGPEDLALAGRRFAGGHVAGREIPRDDGLQHAAE